MKVHTLLAAFVVLITFLAANQTNASQPVNAEFAALSPTNQKQVLQDGAKTITKNLKFSLRKRLKQDDIDYLVQEMYRVHARFMQRYIDSDLGLITNENTDKEMEFMFKELVQFYEKTVYLKSRKKRSE